MRSRSPRAGLGAVAVILATLAFTTSGAVGVATADVEVPTVDSSWTVPAPLGSQSGSLNIVVTLSDPSLAVATKNRNLSPGQQRQYVAELGRKQESLSGRAQATGAKELARLTKALNAIVFSVDSSKIGSSRRIRGSRRSGRSTTTRSICGDGPVHRCSGRTGHRRRRHGHDIAIIDSGIDYTHENFGGPGTAAAYTAAYGTQARMTQNKTRRPVSDRQGRRRVRLRRRVLAEAGSTAVLHPIPTRSTAGRQ